MNASQRAKEIRNATPNCIEELFEMQNRICDLCNQPIQDLILAHLDHSIPVIKYARCLDISIEDAVRECNHSNNLRVAHFSCNTSKGEQTREEWFAKGLDKKVDQPHIYTEEELSELRSRLSIIGRKGGLKNVESGHLARISAAGGRMKGAKNKGVGLFVPGYLQQGIGAKKVIEDKIGIFAPGYLQKGIGGRISGPKIRDQHKGIFAPGMAAKGARRRNELYGNPLTKEICAKGGHIAGTNAKKLGTGIFAISKEQQRINGQIGAHISMHVNRGIVNPNCVFCKKID